MLGDLSVAHAHDVDGLELNFPTCRRHPKKLSQVGSVIGLVGRHPVTIGQLPVDFGVKVGESGTEDLVELSRAGLVGRSARLRRVIEEVVGLMRRILSRRICKTTAACFGVSASPYLITSRKIRRYYR